ncbi:hypothetical protein STRTUCAR8_03222, partial [Streptomyces turgidiscabies Car8]
MTEPTRQTSARQPYPSPQVQDGAARPNPTPGEPAGRTRHPDPRKPQSVVREEWR